MRKMLSLLLLLAVAACKKEEAVPVQARLAVATDTSNAAAPPPAKTAQAATGAAAPIDRMIIRNAAIALVVRDAAKAIDTITAAIESGGGYVASSNTWRESDVLHGKLSLRVPNARLSSALGAIRGAGIRVQSENITSEIIKLYDQAHPGTGAATAPAKPASPPPAAPKPPANPPATKKQ